MRRTGLLVLCLFATAAAGCRKRKPHPARAPAPVALPRPVLAPPLPRQAALPAVRPAAPAPRRANPPDGGGPIGSTALDGGTVNGHPNGPRAEALNAVVSSLGPSVQSCLDGATGISAGVDVPIQVSYRIRPNGRAANVQVSAPSGADDCIRRAVDNLQFPKFEGDPVSGSFPYAYRRTMVPGGQAR